MITNRKQGRKNSEKIQNKKTIVKVRRGGGQQGMVKDHTFALFNFGTFPLVDCIITKLIFICV